MSKRGPQDTEYLSRRQRKVIELRVRGLTQEQICDYTGYSRPWVSTILNSPAGMAYRTDFIEAHPQLPPLGQYPN